MAISRKMVVLDTSVIYKWIVHEPGPALSSALSLLEKLISGEEQVMAPDILLYVIGNVLTHKSALTPDDIDSAWKRFQSFGVEIFTPDTQFIKKCIDLCKDYEASLYDASYVILAQQLHCNLITADTKFVSQVNLPLVKTIEEYTKEEK